MQFKYRGILFLDFRSVINNTFESYVYSYYPLAVVFAR